MAHVLSSNCSSCPLCAVYEVSANSSEVVLNCFEDRSVHSDATRLLQSLLSVGGPAFA